MNASSRFPLVPTGPFGTAALAAKVGATIGATIGAIIGIVGHLGARWPMATAAVLVAMAAAGPALAQRPMSEASVEALVSALSPPAQGQGGTLTRSFRRTQLPDATSNLCAVSAKPGAAPAAAARARSDAPARRNLEIVPYGGDTTPGVNLSVQFALGSDKLSPRDLPLLDNVAEALKSQALAADGFAIAGHTDSTGDGRINLELSCARAQAVRRYLVGKGVAESRLTAYGFGSDRPLQGEDAAMAANRRVEVRRAPQ
jgi:outer membrane protein OmpA-like peptidoglycan-associated protein